MAGRVITSVRKWKGSRDDEGHRTWNMSFLVQMEFAGDGPSMAMTTPGLPLPGSFYFFGNDIDIWAYCKLSVDVSPQFEKGGNYYFELTYTFSTKSDVKSCKDQQIENPLLEPMKVSGGTKNFTNEATYDYLGKPVTNSSLEPIRGPQNEWDDGRDTITIEQNVAVLDLAFCAAMRNRVNQYPLWGLPPRCIKLSDFTWDEKFYGQCFPYYTRKFTFDVKPESFDREVLDEGTKVLKGHWDIVTGDWILENVGGSPPSLKNPSHFIRYKDRKGENARTLLDQGKPWVPSEYTTACYACPTNMPIDLIVTGLDRKIILKWDNGCVWKSIDTADVQEPNLEFDPGLDLWIFQMLDFPDAPGGTWAIDANKWNCVGANTLPRTIGPHPAPFVVITQPQAPTTVIKKYGTADFLLLGIPILL